MALLTDYGLADDYAGLMHAVIQRDAPEARVVDLCHEVEPGNILQAAFLLVHDSIYFPAGTVFVAIVDPGVGTDRKILTLRHIRSSEDKVYYLAPDNGLLDPVIEWWRRDGGDVEVFSGTVKSLMKNLTRRRGGAFRPVSSTFHGRDVFAPLAVEIARGIPLETFFAKTDRWETCAWRMPGFGTGAVIGRVVYADHFGNLITDIPADDRYGSVYILGRQVPGMMTFAEIPDGEFAWLRGSKGTIEIVMNGRSCADALRAGSGETVAFNPDDRLS